MEYMQVTIRLMSRSYGTHSPIETLYEGPLPSHCIQFTLRSSGGQDVEIYDEKLIVETAKLLDTENKLLTVSGPGYGTGVFRTTLFKPWAKYFHTQIIDIELEAKDYDKKMDQAIKRRKVWVKGLKSLIKDAKKEVDKRTKENPDWCPAFVKGILNEDWIGKTLHEKETLEPDDYQRMEQVHIEDAICRGLEFDVESVAQALRVFESYKEIHRTKGETK